MENDNYLSIYIKSLQDQIESLKSEVHFLRTELKGNKETVKVLVQSVSKKGSGNNMERDIYFIDKIHKSELPKNKSTNTADTKQNNNDTENLHNEDNGTITPEIVINKTQETVRKKI